MMIRLKFIYLFFAAGILHLSVTASASSLSPAPSASSVDTSSVKTGENVVADSAAVNKKKGFNASAYSMQKRYRVKNASQFVNGGFLNNSSLSLIGSGFRLTDPCYTSGPSLHLSFGKWFSPYHAVRAEAGVAFWEDNYDGAHVKEASVKFSYLFNLSSYIWGYDTSRFCEISTVVGPGYSYLWRSGASAHCFTSHIGLNLNLRVFPDFDIFIEPLFELYSHSSILSYGGTWRRVAPGFNGRVGLSYKLGQKNPAADFPGDGWFVYLTGGPNFQNSSVVYERIGVSKALGPHINVGAGKWYKDFFAFRLSLYYSDCKWMKYLTSKSLPAYYAGARLEGQFDVVKFIMQDRDPRVRASVLFGPEAGMYIKKDMDFNVRGVYVGLTAALQASVRIAKGFSVIAEPRLSIVPYSAPTDNRTRPDNNRNYYDALLNFNLGIQYDLPIAR